MPVGGAVPGRGTVQGRGAVLKRAAGPPGPPRRPGRVWRRRSTRAAARRRTLPPRGRTSRGRRSAWCLGPGRHCPGRVGSAVGQRGGRALRGRSVPGGAASGRSSGRSGSGEAASGRAEPARRGRVPAVPAVPAVPVRSVSVGPFVPRGVTQAPPGIAFPWFEDDGEAPEDPFTVCTPVLDDDSRTRRRSGAAMNGRPRRGHGLPEARGCAGNSDRAWRSGPAPGMENVVVRHNAARGARGCPV